jgi:enoyl-CoA hydratase/carnithine racemase
MTQKPENQGQTTFSAGGKDEKSWSVPVLLVENRGAVRLLTMNRPEKRNALNSGLTQGLLDALRAADADESVGAVVLTGAGQGFCAGADLTEFKDLGTGVAAEDRAELTMQLHLFFSRMRVPVVSAINGHAMGGGAGLAIAADLAVMAPAAKIGYPETRHGIVAAIVMANLVRQVGRKAAFELVALGEPVDAQRALQLGMVNRVSADPVAEAVALAEKLAAVKPAAMKETKRLFHEVVELALAPALERGRDTNKRMRNFAQLGKK